MAALEYDLEVEQGSTYRRTVPVLDEDGNPLDVTGWTVRGQVRLTPLSPVVLLDLGPHLTVSGTSVELAIPGTVSSLWAWREATYDVELVAPSAAVTRLLRGRVLVDPETTR